MVVGAAMVVVVVVVVVVAASRLETNACARSSEPFPELWIWSIASGVSFDFRRSVVWSTAGFQPRMPPGTPL